MDSGDAEGQGQSRRRIRLRSGARSLSPEDLARSSWAHLIEVALQNSIARLANRRDTGQLELESTAFAKSLVEAAKGNLGRHDGRTNAQLSLFSRPLGLYSFQLLKREFICIEHSGYARRKAEAWWRERCLDPCPATAEEALDLAEVGLVAAPESITVRSIAGQKYDRIIKQSLGPLPTEALEEAPF